MDKEDKRRYFVVGSVYLEVVTPLFQQKLKEKYEGLNFRCLKDFLNKDTVIHILFHLRNRHAWCCTDKAHCTKRRALPLNHHQWKQLYSEKPDPGIHNCFCKYTAKAVKPEDLDMSLCGLILSTCCNLAHLDEKAILILRQNKHDYLSHNTTCGITKYEYGPLMDELKTNILQLDQTKEDELIKIKIRPLDDAQCNKYVTHLLDIHQMLDKFDPKLDWTRVHMRDIMDKTILQLDDKVEEIFQYVSFQSSIKEIHKKVDLRLKSPNNHVTRQEVDSNRTDREYKRRYFIVGSVYLEIVSTLFQQKLKNFYMKSNLRCLQDFLDVKPVIHTLYHIRHQNSICCTDKTNCMTNIHFTITCHQWEQLYTTITGQIEHNCFCSYTAKSARLEELDVNLCGVILLNCCYLEDLDQKAVHALLQFKNEYLSHNRTCGIYADEYDKLWNNIIQSVLQLDPSKERDMIRIRQRPLDDSLCNKYMITLLDIHEKFEKVDTNIELSTAQTLETINTKTARIISNLEDILQHLKYKSSYCKETRNEQGIKEKSIKLYQCRSSVTPIHDVIALMSAVDGETTGEVKHGVIKDDRSFKQCQALINQSMILNEDGLPLKLIIIHDMAWYFTPIKMYKEPSDNFATFLPGMYYDTCLLGSYYDLETYVVPERRRLTSWMNACGYSTGLIIDYQKKQRVALFNVFDRVIKSCRDLFKVGDPFRMLSCTCMKTYDKNEKFKIKTTVGPEQMEFVDIASLIKLFVTSSHR